MGARTADLNRDGFITQDELIAMQRAGLEDQEIVARLRDTGQIFDLTPQQEEELLEAGVSRRVLRWMLELNLNAPAR